MGPEGCNQDWLQPEAFRAPEVWTLVRCYHKSDVWSLASLVWFYPCASAKTNEEKVLKWVDDDLLGNHDNNGPFPPMTWCLAKIMRLFNTPEDSIASPPDTVREDLRDSFRFAEKLSLATRSDDPNRPVLETPSFEQWAETAESLSLVPTVVVNMIRYLAVLDPKRRPTAAQALASDELRALESAAATSRMSEVLM